MIKNQQTVREDKKKACEISKKNKLPITRTHAFRLLKIKGTSPTHQFFKQERLQILIY